MVRNRFFVVILSILFFTNVLLSQETVTEIVDGERENPPETTKIDEFGRAGDCDLSARIDNFLIQLTNNPKATGYIIVYTGADSLPSQYEDSPMLSRIQKVIAVREHEISRLVFIKGGFRESGVTEFFLVPFGGVPPEPTATVPKPKTPKDTFLWSWSWLSTDDEYALLNEFILPAVQAKIDEESRLADLENSEQVNTEKDSTTIVTDDAITPDSEVEVPEEEQLTSDQISENRFAWTDKKFGSEIGKRHGATGVIIFYADDQYYDVAKIEQFVSDGRAIIASDAKLSPDQIKVVFGGYRDTPSVEYYIVPKNGKLPDPKPEEREVDYE